ncbi:CLUMA_CG013729, isoform A [Clunio marinus]|uniref:CLUMA_CG013729, isoform A n=1 Tax=Clunio marinus TaxID=568069 RepID=A0A1J1IJQ8_9DIPT|nr:CLUMA_CG013729, isoform A [Clunio marinus]
MYQFSNWCFLCADEDGGEVKIQTLDVCFKEIIGEFSIINFTLKGIPSAICKSCYLFLKQYKEHKETYARAEQMFLELLRTKGKAIDISAIKAKHNLNKFDFQYNENNEDALSIREPEPEEDSISFQLENTTIEPTTPAPTELVSTILNKITSKTYRNLFKCDMCSHASSTRTSIERHMKQIHLKKKSKVLTCKVCNKAFAKKNILDNHKKIHLIERPTFPCPECGKELSSLSAVSSHINWIHKIKREFKCETCLKMFATKGSLKEHVKIHSNIKEHVCVICKKSFKTVSVLTNHLDTHNETGYGCSDCGLRLNSKRTLRQHMLKHSDINKFSCEICNAKFKRVKGYKDHLISMHTDIKAYKCPWCPKTFSNGANCRKHKKCCHTKEFLQAEKNEGLKEAVKLPSIDEILSKQS